MPEQPDSAWRRWAWFAGLWVASVAALGAVAWVLRQVMGWAGLTA
ncbi:MAG: DUF2474 domain-containing protein [Spongiibacteraceae bacterium]|nr:DUF2474 domain-containing protein [Spongiibacteraceae bacterium]